MSNQIWELCRLGGSRTQHYKKIGVDSCAKCEQAIKSRKDKKSKDARRKFNTTPIEKKKKKGVDKIEQTTRSKIEDRLLEIKLKKEYAE